MAELDDTVLSATDAAAKIANTSLSVSMPSSVFDAVRKMTSAVMGPVADVLKNINAISSLRDSAAGAASATTTMTGIVSSMASISAGMTTLPAGASSDPVAMKAHIDSLIGSMSSAATSASSTANQLSSGVTAMAGTGKAALSGAAASTVDAHSAVGAVSGELKSHLSELKSMSANLASGGAGALASVTGSLGSLATKVQSTQTTVAGSVSKLAVANEHMGNLDPKVDLGAAMSMVNNVITLTNMGVGSALPMAMTVNALKQSKQLDAVKAELQKPSSILPDPATVETPKPVDPVKDPSAAIADWKSSVTTEYNNVLDGISKFTAGNPTEYGNQLDALLPPYLKVREQKSDIAKLYNDPSILEQCNLWFLDQGYKLNLRMALKDKIFSLNGAILELQSDKVVIHSANGP